MNKTCRVEWLARAILNPGWAGGYKQQRGKRSEKIILTTGLESQDASNETWGGRRRLNCVCGLGSGHLKRMRWGCAERRTQNRWPEVVYPQKHMLTDTDLNRRGFSWLDKEAHACTHVQTHTHTHALMLFPHRGKETLACRITGWDQRQVLAKCGSGSGLLLTDKCGRLAQRFTAATVKWGSHSSSWQTDVVSRHEHHRWSGAEASDTTQASSWQQLLGIISSDRLMMKLKLSWSYLRSFYITHLL